MGIFNRRDRLGVNANPSVFETWIKRAVLLAFAWHLISAEMTQHLVNHYQLWSA